MTELADLYPNPYQWMAGFISTSSKLRPTHVDWYDSLLVPLKGSKILQVGNRPYKKISGMFYSYSEDHGFSDSSYLEEQVTVTPGQALAIPAFVPHQVINSRDEECIALSLSFDTTTFFS